MDDFSLVNPPRYIVRQYTDSIFKIVRMNHSVKYVVGGDKPPNNVNDQKLDNNLSRAKKVVLELALCNPWDWFFTLTIDPNKFDRGSLDVWYKTFSQWLRDQRKKGVNIKYLVIPEQHEDGKWHCHGFLYGDMNLIPFRSVSRPVPRYLIDKGFYDWPAYSSKFGFCSLGRIRSHVKSAFYVTKYLTKNPDRMVTAKGSHLYYASLGLNRSEKIFDLFDNCPQWDKYLTHSYEFCKVGMPTIKNSWTELFDDSVDCENLFSLELPDQTDFLLDLCSINYEQTSFTL